MKVIICGSIEFTPQMLELKEQLEALYHEVNIPYMAQKIANGEIPYEEFLQTKNAQGGDTIFRQNASVDVIKRYRNLIASSDAILVLNLDKKWIENYIGGNTLMEMWFAYGFDKKIFLYNPLPQPSERIHYLDEIVATKPIVINWDVSKIQ